MKSSRSAGAEIKVVRMVPSRGSVAVSTRAAGPSDDPRDFSAISRSSRNASTSAGRSAVREAPALHEFERDEAPALECARAEALHDVDLALAAAQLLDLPQHRDLALERGTLGRGEDLQRDRPLEPRALAREEDLRRGAAA